MGEHEKKEWYWWTKSKVFQEMRLYLDLKVFDKWQERERKSSHGNWPDQGVYSSQAIQYGHENQLIIHSINFYWAPIARRQASQVALVVKNLLQCRRRKRLELDPWTRKIPWRRKWQPIPVFSPGKFHVQRSLAGYSSWGCRESDTTEWLNVGTMLILQSRHLGGLYKVYIFQKDYWKIRLGQRQPGIDLRQNWMLG